MSQKPDGQQKRFGNLMGNKNDLQILGTIIIVCKGNVEWKYFYLTTSQLLFNIS